MDRLISANKLEEELHALMKRRGVKSWLSTAFDASDFEALIDEAETVEAEPVDRGWWIFYPKASAGGSDVWCCSECGQGYTWVEAHNFCPNCGAKMNEDV